MTNDYHIPVLLNECIEGLKIDAAGTYVDATLGGGGHTAAILQKLTTGRLVAFEQDEDAWHNVPADPRCSLVKDNFRRLSARLSEAGIRSINGLIADLGISSYQLDTPGRGFGFSTGERPDMRMNAESETTAASILNTYKADALKRLLKEFGELKHAGTLTNAIVRARDQKKIESMNDLMNILKPRAPRGAENRFYARVFQALRIEVNDELGALKDLLTQASALMVRGGRLVVLSYHSLEDRIVKNFIRSGNFQGTLQKDVYGSVIRPFDAINRKPLTPSDAECERNPRSRSAKLRIAEKN